MLSPGSTGVLPDAHAQNMHVGGSKGSISGNHAMAKADLLIVIGSRAVCQADCSGIGYKRREAGHQHQRRSRRRHPLQQHARAHRRHRGGRGAARGQARSGRRPMPTSATGLRACAAKKAEWRAYKQRALCRGADQR